MTAPVSSLPRSADPPRRRPGGFNDAYLGQPPWDIGGPQPEVVRLAEENEFSGDVLDIGCGTGENALELARRGMTVWGVDAAPRAIDRARVKAKERSIPVEFRVGDALELDRIGHRFGSILDCGLLHVFDDAERAEYVHGLHRALRPDGRYFFLVFSDAEPDWGGPRRMSEAEIRSAFSDGWTIDFLRPARFATKMAEVQGKAWCARIRRIGR